MLSSILSSWKTTLAGLIVGLAVVFPQIQSCATSGFAGCDWTKILVGIGIAALGAFAKDHGASA
jgi:hypothetical protein